MRLKENAIWLNDFKLFRVTWQLTMWFHLSFPITGNYSYYMHAMLCELDIVFMAFVCVCVCVSVREKKINWKIYLTEIDRFAVDMDIHGYNRGYIHGCVIWKKDKLQIRSVERGICPIATSSKTREFRRFGHK